MLKLSLIIPVYNEERHIRACLDAIAVQTVPVDQVVVVDNNCSDRTIEIAREYDFVEVVHEPKQGRGYARSAGFNAARGDILGRIDADSRIAKNWVEIVKPRFSEDPTLSGMTGLAYTDILPGTGVIKSTFFSRFYYWFAHSGFNTITMWGANMAIRRSAWTAVKSKVLDDHLELHEDQDLSLWIAARGDRITQENKMLITTNGQGYRYLPKLWRYSMMFKHTKTEHSRNGNLRSPKLHKLGFWSTFPGRMYAALVWVAIAAPVTVFFFPADIVVTRFWPKSRWLD